MKKKFKKIKINEETKKLWNLHNEKTKNEKDIINQELFIINDYKRQIIEKTPNENLKREFFSAKHEIKKHLKETLLLREDEVCEFMAKIEKEILRGNLTNDEINISKIEKNVIASIKRLGIDLQTGVTFGSSNSSHLEMSQYHVMTTGGSVIMTNNNFQIFIFRASKLISKCLSYEFINADRSNVLTCSTKAIENYSKSDSLIQEWNLFFENYSKYDNHPDKGEAVKYTNRTQAFASNQILNSMLAFSLGHEVAHHAANHCEINYTSDGNGFIPSSHQYEYIADIVGLDCILNINIDGQPNYFCKLGVGSVYLLKILKFTNIFRNYKKSGNFLETEDAGHPKYDDRINTLENFVKSKYKESDLVAHQFNEAKALLEHIFLSQKEIVLNGFPQKV